MGENDAVYTMIIQETFMKAYDNCTLIILVLGFDYMV